MRGHLIVDVPLIAAAVSLAPVYGLAPLAWITLAATGIHTWGVVNPRSSLYMPVWWRLPKGSDGVALTFDDGPHPERTPAVLDLLAKHGQKATFFLIGENVRRHPALVRRIVDEGHAVGLHSDTHSWWFNCWPPPKLRRDLERCAASISDATGRAAPTLFRPPVGLKNPMVGFVTGRLGLRTVTWSCRALDTGSATVEQVTTRLANGLKPRAILGMHDGAEPDKPRPGTLCVDALARLLPILRERGLTSRALCATQRGIDVG
ncbi:MAG: polysaccharide deacetylase family protein [Planctomycetes bacterium]|nr:polysaccharide deacetylase family protein [Planctomycetota bacterium]